MRNMNLFTRIEWKIYKLRKRGRLRNASASLLADNCNAGIILHDLALRFNTPTVNLFFDPADYLKFLKRLPYYLSLAPELARDDSVGWPVGCLDDVRVHFMHYDSFANAASKWCERAKRVNMNNLFVMMTDRNGCTYEQICEFDALPYKHKVIFTHKPHPEISSAFYMPGFEDQKEVGVLTEFKAGFPRRRYIDAFDYVAFLNGAPCVWQNRNGANNSV